jgi:hypothetical protein
MEKAGGMFILQGAGLIGRKRKEKRANRNHFYYGINMSIRPARVVDKIYIGISIVVQKILIKALESC